MNKRNRKFGAAAAIFVFGISQLPAQAFTPLMLIDRFIKKETKMALQTPGHVAWCKKNHPGYRPKWNNYRIANGRVKYCASPYFSPSWMKWRQPGRN